MKEMMIHPIETRFIIIGIHNSLCLRYESWDDGDGIRRSFDIGPFSFVVSFDGTLYV